MRKTSIIALLVLASMRLVAQSDLAFYHMGAITPQSSMNNASFFPDAEFYLSFPGVSGVNLKMNSGFSYNDLMIPVAGTDSVKVDLPGVLNSLQEGDNLRLSGDLSIFQLGVVVKNKTFSLFSNIRYNVGMTYPVDFLNYFVYGNGNFIGERVEEKNISGGGIAYSEVGLGYTQAMAVMGDKELRIGARVKYLHGLFYADAADNASISMFTDADTYDLSVTFNNATFRAVGLNELEGDDASAYAIGFGSNENTGFAVDLGAELAINDRLSALFSVNDLGSITWRQDAETYTLNQGEYVLGGFENLDDVDIGQALEDSLDLWGESQLTNEEFTTAIGTRYLVGASYKLTENGVATGTVSRVGSPYGKDQLGFGAGYTHQVGKILTVSTTFSKEQHQPFKVGGGMMLRLGLFQFYGAFDDILNSVRDVGDISGVDARIGLNFMIGRKKTGPREPKPKKEKKKKEELSPFPPGYDLDHLEIKDSEEDQEDLEVSDQDEDQRDGDQ